MNTDETRKEIRYRDEDWIEIKLGDALNEIDRLEGENKTLEALSTVGNRRAFIEEIEQRIIEACKKAKPDSSPWPEDIWPMTDKEYVKAIPDKNKRTAISGFLMRKGWELAIEDFEQAIDSVEVK